MKEMKEMKSTREVNALLVVALGAIAIWVIVHLVFFPFGLGGKMWHDDLWCTTNDSEASCTKKLQTAEECYNKTQRVWKPEKTCEWPAKNY